MVHGMWGLLTKRVHTQVLTMLALLPLAALAFMARPVYPYIEDDSLISLRYAQRLLDGHGLSWTDGRAVEGYSNLLWVLLCAGLGALGMDLILAARVLGCASVAIALWALARLQPLRGPGGASPALVSGLWLCLSGPAAVWSMGGLEQPLVLALLMLTLIDVAALCGPPGFVVRPAPTSGRVFLFGAQRRRPYFAAAALALLVWTRPDSPIFVLLTGLVLLIMAPGLRSDRLAAAAIVVVIPAAACLAQLGFRVVYYGELVPNTALIKAAWRPDQLTAGQLYLEKGFRYLWPLVLGGGFGAAIGMASAGARAITLLQLAWILGWSGYVVMIGGDHFPGHRHLLLVVGLCVSLTAQGLRLLFARAPWVATIAVLMLLAGTPAFAKLQRRDPDYDMGKLARWQWDGKPLGETVARAAAPRRPLWAVTAAGCIPYFSGLPALDLLGLNDAHIARQPADHHFSLAHDHGDGRYVLDRRPDLITFGLPGGTTPQFLSGTQMQRDPRFVRDYRGVTLSTLRPHVMESFTYVRLQGLMGIVQSADRVSYPGYLLRGQLRGIPMADGALGGLLPARQRVVTEELELPQGTWKVELAPASPLLQVDVQLLKGRLRARVGQEPVLQAMEGPVRIRLGLRSAVELALTQLVLRRDDRVRLSPDRTIDEGRNLTLRTAIKLDLMHASRQVLATFDTLPTDWDVQGNAMATTKGTLPRQQPVTGHQGTLLNTFHSSFGDQRTGSLRSPKFPILPHALLRARVGGGRADQIIRQVGLGLYVDGVLVHVISGKNTEQLVEHVLDLSPYEGRILELEIFDRSQGFFGHILVDELSLLHDTWAPEDASLSVADSAAGR